MDPDTNPEQEGFTVSERYGFWVRTTVDVGISEMWLDARKQVSVPGRSTWLVVATLDANSARRELGTC
jgi:hypothetical protein